MKTTLHWMTSGFVLIGCLALTVIADAPDTPVPAPLTSAAETSLPTAEQIDAKIKAAQTAADLPEAVRNGIVQQYEQAKAHLLRLKTIHDNIAALQTTAKQAPALTEQINQALAQPVPEAPAIDSQAQTLTLDQLDQRSREADAALAKARQVLKEQGDKVDYRRNRSEEIPKALDAARKSLAEVEANLEAPAPADEPAMAREARRLAQVTQQAVLRAEITSLEQEQRFQEVLLQLRQAQQAQADRRVNELDAQAKRWQAAAAARRTAEARKAVQEAKIAEKQTETMPPAISELARINTELTRRHETLVAKVAQLEARKKQAETQLKNLDEQFTRMRQYVRQAGLDETVGLLLRSQREALPGAGKYRDAAADRQAEIRATNAAQFALDQTRKTLSDLDEQVRRIVAQLGSDLTESYRRRMADRARELLTRRREYTDDLYTTYTRYLEVLREIDSTERQLQTKTALFRQFIDANLMWSRSAAPINMQTFRQTGEAVGWLVSPGRWTETGHWFVRQISDQPVRFGLLALVWAVLGAIGLKWRHRLGVIAGHIGRVKEDTMALTFEALAVTALRAVLWPGLAALGGWVLWRQGDRSMFAVSLGRALLVTAGFWVVLRGMRLFCAAQGMARVHFRWPEAVCQTLRHHLGWLTVVVLPMLAVVLLMDSPGHSEYGASLGRLCFLVIGVAVAVALAMVLRPSGPLIGAWRRAQDGGPVRAWWLWYPLVVVLSIVPVVMSAMGYDYAAHLLLYRFFVTAVVMLGLFFLLQAMLLRWLLVTHRRMAYQQALSKIEESRRQRQAEQQADGATGSAGGLEEAIGPGEPQIDLAQLAQDTRRMIRTLTGFAFLMILWFVWSPVLPALAFLHDVHVWSYTTQIDGVVRQMPISLANLILAVLVVVISVIATRNLPGVLEMALLNRLPLDDGLRYAITALSRYTLIGVGFVLAVRLIGVGWSDVQWLIAALGVGIGFGLQEIVANFISGLILLFERPIRVGDIVEVGDVMGIVSRIRIRATTITNWDRKEYIVPNKDFITGRLLNWTLSNKINRIVINVGVAYGSNIEQVRAILRRITDEHPLIMKDPKTLISFEGFGDNALNFVVRTYLPDFENRIEVVHQLHQTIYDELNKAGVGIAFPQRDVHLDTTRPLDIRVVRGPDAATDETNPTPG